MVDDGSTLNLFPLKILPHLGLLEEIREKSNTIVRGYDDLKCTVIGIFEAEVTVEGL